MQSIMNTSAQTAPSLRLSFFGSRNYMMRSEKRGSTAPSAGGSSGGKRPRRHRAGFFYKLGTLLMLIIFWPIGMLMLWRRKLRWRGLTKLLASVLTLAICVVGIGYALTVQTDSVRYTAMQDSVNGLLDDAATSITGAAQVVANKAVTVYNGAAELGEAVLTGTRAKLADGIDSGVSVAMNARNGIGEVFAAKETAEPEASPAATDAVEATTSATTDTSAAPDTTDAPSASTATGETAPTDAPSTAASAKPVELATSVPSTEIIVNAEDSSVPVYASSAPLDAASAQQIAEGTLARSGILTEGKLPSVAPTALTEAPTVEATPGTLSITIKPAAEALVYYNESGKSYHMATVCKGMTTAQPHTLGEAVENGYLHCGNCDSPDENILQEALIVWVDENNLAHTSDECSKFSGSYRLMSASNAIAEGIGGCDVCAADDYLSAVANGDNVICQTPTPAPTDTPEPTPKPTPVASASASTNAPENSAAAPDESTSPAASPAAQAEAASEEPTIVETVEPSATAEPSDMAEPSDTIEPSDTPAPTNTPTPTPEPTEEVTPEPTVAVVVPTVTLKPAGEAIVYHSSNGKWYHTNNHCSGMTGGDPYTLAECVEGGYRCCNTCNAPAPELLEENCLWMDEDGLCHTSDECASFVGTYTLITREDALEQGLTGCTECGADEYLVPDTQIDYASIVAAAVATATATATAAE